VSAAMTEPEFGAMAQRHQRELYLHCRRVLGSSHDAEDAVQDALLRAWRSRDRLRAATLFRPWLRRIATNACIDIIKSRDRRVPVEPDAVPEEVPPRWAPDDTYARVAGQETLELTVEAVFQVLPPRERSVLLLRDLLGYETTEVAELLDTGATSVYSAHQRARRRMRVHLTADRSAAAEPPMAQAGRPSTGGAIG
jgi:RNA polymerase sigma factor (sigma-70 family)